MSILRMISWFPMLYVLTISLQGAIYDFKVSEMESYNWFVATLAHSCSMLFDMKHKKPFTFRFIVKTAEEHEILRAINIEGNFLGLLKDAEFRLDMSEVEVQCENLLYDWCLWATERLRELKNTDPSVLYVGSMLGFNTPRFVVDKMMDNAHQLNTLQNYLHGVLSLTGCFDKLKEIDCSSIVIQVDEDDESRRIYMDVVEENERRKLLEMMTRDVKNGRVLKELHTSTVDFVLRDKRFYCLKEYLTKAKELALTSRNNALQSVFPATRDDPNFPAHEVTVHAHLLYAGRRYVETFIVRIPISR